MVELITNNYPYRDDAYEILDQDDGKRISDLLLGRKVTKVNDDHLLLDNGTVIKVVPNEGGCICGAGDYYLEALNDCDNIITHVEVDVEGADDGDYYEVDLSYRIYVVAEDKRINLVEIDGNDGNGYYGTGYRLIVRVADERKET